MWDDLDDQAKEMICRVVVHEADRHIQRDYSVPYWNGKGGDSKAEENSWEAPAIVGCQTPSALEVKSAR